MALCSCYGTYVVMALFSYAYTHAYTHAYTAGGSGGPGGPGGPHETKAGDESRRRKRETKAGDESKWACALGRD